MRNFNDTVSKQLLLLAAGVLAAACTSANSDAEGDEETGTSMASADVLSNDEPLVAGKPGPTSRLCWDDRQAADGQPAAARPVCLGSPVAPTADGATQTWAEPVWCPRDEDAGLAHCGTRAPSSKLAGLPNAPQESDTILIIDSSGSMATNDPGDRRKEGARTFVTLSQDDNQIAVVDFDSIVTTLSELKMVPAQTLEVKAAIDLIDSSGGTDIGAGVQRGFEILSTSSPSDPFRNRNAVLLTDGIGSYNNEHLQFLHPPPGQNWPIWTLGFGQADKTLLCRIALETGGDYNAGEDCSSPSLPFPIRIVGDCSERGDCAPAPLKQSTAPVNALGPESLLCAFQHIRAKMDGGDDVNCVSNPVTPEVPLELDHELDPNHRVFTATVGWAVQDAAVDVALIAPSGRVITGDVPEPDVAHDGGNDFEVFRVSDAERGVWRVRVESTVAQNVVAGIAGIPGSNEPPDVSAAAPSVPLLSPPNHRLRLLNIVGVSDPNGDPVTLTITGVTQDEPVGSGANAPDAFLTADSGLLLRAERKAKGNGRVYRISFLANDGHGGETPGAVSVCVPVDMKEDPSCIDSGQQYNSLVPTR